MKTAVKGFTLVEIMIVVLIIGIIVGIAVPSFMSARDQSRAKACQEAQMKAWGATQQWAMESGAGGGETPTYAELVGATLYLTSTPKCPIGPLDIVLVEVDQTPECPNLEAGHDPFD